MKIFSFALLAFSCLLITGCSNKQTVTNGPKGFNEQKVRGGNNFKLEDVAAQMESQGIKDVFTIPSEQQAPTRSHGDPIEVVMASASPNAGSETINIGLFYNSEDAQSSYVGAKERVKAMVKAKQEQFVIVRICNAMFIYDPGNDLRDLKLQGQAKQLEKTLKLACEDPKKYPLGKASAPGDGVDVAPSAGPGSASANSTGTSSADSTLKK